MVSRTLIVTIMGQNMLSGTMASAANSAQALAQSLTAIGRSMTMAITLPVIMAGVSVSKAGIDFDREMRNIQAIGQLTDAQTKALGDSLVAMSLDMSKTTESAIALARGYYFIESAGIYGADATEILTVGTKMAAAGLTDTETALRTLIPILYAYKLPVSEAAHISDVMFRSVDLGIYSMEEFASVLGPLTVTASMAGIKFEEIAAAMASLSHIGLNPSASSVALNNFIRGYIVQTDKAHAAGAALGIDMSVTHLAAIGLGGAIQELVDKTGMWTIVATGADASIQAQVKGMDAQILALEGERIGLGVSTKANAGRRAEINLQIESLKHEQKVLLIAKDENIDYNRVMEEMGRSTGLATEQLALMFPNIRSLRGALGLTVNEGQDYFKMLDAMKGASEGAGRTQEVYATQIRAVSAEITSFKSAVTALAIDLSRFLLPAISAIIKFVRGLIIGFMLLSDPVKRGIIIFLGLAAAIGPLLMIAGQLISAFLVVGRMFSILGPGIAAISGPILLVVGSLVLLSTAYARNFLGFRDFIGRLWTGVTTTFGAIGKRIGEFIAEWNKVPHEMTILDAGVAFSGNVDTGLTKLVDGLKKSLAQLKTGDILGAAKTVFDLIDWSAIGTWLAAGWAKVKGIGENFLYWLAGELGVSKLYLGLNRVFGEIDWQFISTLLAAGWAKVTGVAEALAHQFYLWIDRQPIFRQIKTALDNLTWADIGTWIAEAWGNIKDVAQKIADQVGKWIDGNKWLSSVKVAISNITWADIGKWIADSWQKVETVAQTLANQVGTWIDNNKWIQAVKAKIDALTVEGITDSVVGWLAKSIEKVADWVTTGAQLLSTQIDAIGVQGAEQFSVNDAPRKSLTEAFQTWIDSALFSLDMNAGSLGESVGKIIGSIIRLGLSALALLVSALASELWESIRGIFVQTTSDSRQERAKSIVTKFLEGVIRGMIEGVLGVPMEEVGKIGLGIVNGIVKGLADGTQFLVDAALKIVKTLLTTVMQSLLIGSPSRVFAEIGLDTMRGLAEGMKEGESEVLDRIAIVLKDIGDAFSSLAGAATAIKGMGAGPDMTVFGAWLTSTVVTLSKVLYQINHVDMTPDALAHARDIAKMIGELFSGLNISFSNLTVPKDVNVAGWGAILEGAVFEINRIVKAILKSITPAELIDVAVVVGVMVDILSLTSTDLSGIAVIPLPDLTVWGAQFYVVFERLVGILLWVGTHILPAALEAADAIVPQFKNISSIILDLSTVQRFTLPDLGAWGAQIFAVFERLVGVLVWTRDHILPTALEAANALAAQFNNITSVITDLSTVKTLIVFPNLTIWGAQLYAVFERLVGVLLWVLSHIAPAALLAAQGVVAQFKDIMSVIADLSTVKVLVVFPNLTIWGAQLFAVFLRCLQVLQTALLLGPAVLEAASKVAGFVTTIMSLVQVDLSKLAATKLPDMTVWEMNFYQAFAAIAWIIQQVRLLISNNVTNADKLLEEMGKVATSLVAAMALIGVDLSKLTATKLPDMMVWEMNFYQAFAAVSWVIQQVRLLVASNVVNADKLLEEMAKVSTSLVAVMGLIGIDWSKLVPYPGKPIAFQNALKAYMDELKLAAELLVVWLTEASVKWKDTLPALALLSQQIVTIVGLLNLSETFAKLELLKSNTIAIVRRFLVILDRALQLIVRAIQDWKYWLRVVPEAELLVAALKTLVGVLDLNATFAALEMLKSNTVPIVRRFLTILDRSIELLLRALQVYSIERINAVSATALALAAFLKNVAEMGTNLTAAIKALAGIKDTPFIATAIRALFDIGAAMMLGMRGGVLSVAASIAALAAKVVQDAIAAAWAALRGARAIPVNPWGSPLDIGPGPANVFSPTMATATGPALQSGPVTGQIPNQQKGNILYNYGTIEITAKDGESGADLYRRLFNKTRTA